MRFLVTAATGRTSAGVVRHLRSADEEVPGLVRDKDTATRTFDDLHGVDIVDGAFDDGVVLAKAFRGVKLPSWPWEVAPIRSGWRRPSSTARCKPDYHTWSSCRASQPATTPPCFVGRLHAEIQDHLAASGLSYTLLHPASFANNLFYKAESVAVEHILPAAAPTGRVAYIDIRDLSEAAALVLRDPTLHGKTYDLSGPDAYTFPEIAELPSMILGHEIKYVPVSPNDRRSALLENGISPWFAELLLSLETSAEAGQIGTVTTTLKELLGREPRTIENFLVENASRFRS